MFERQPLAYLIEYQKGGGTPSRTDNLLWGGEIPWASVKDFSDESLELRHTEEYITEAGLRASTSNLIPAGVPLVCTRMAVGRAAVALMSVAINQDVRALYPNRDTHPGYLLRLIASLQPRAEAQSVGSTVKGIRTTDYLALEVPIAPSDEQPIIAQVLDTLDTQIRQTEALIAKLERIKQGLLTDLLTRGIDQNGQLRPTPDQAPHLYKESPLGRIPREWEVCSLAEVLDGIDAGKSPSCQDIPATGDQWGVLKVGAVHPEGLRPFENKVVDDTRLRKDAYLVRDGDLLISRANTSELVGLVCLVDNVPKNLMLSDKTLRLKVDELRMSVRFLFLQLQMSASRRQIEMAATGTSGSMKNISQSNILRLLIPCPPLTEQQAIASKSADLDKRLVTERAACQQMEKIKAGLTDDLLTGRVRVTLLLDTAESAT